MLSAGVQGKLDRIAEIRDEISTLEQELEELLGSPAPTAAPKDKKAEKDERAGKKVRVCSICGKPGHDVRKCPRGVGMHPDNPKPSKGREPCAECGSTGTRHFKTCSRPKGAAPTKAFASPDTSAEIPKEPLTPDQYEKVRSEMHDRNFSTGQFSLINKMRPSEVNSAIRSEDYEDYLATR